MYISGDLDGQSWRDSKLFVVSKYLQIPAARAQKIKQEQHIQKLSVDLPAGGGSGGGGGGGGSTRRHRT